VAVGTDHSLALGWDGRVYSWGENDDGQLGHGNLHTKFVPALVEGLEVVRGISAEEYRSLAVTQSGDVFRWGHALQPYGPGEAERALRSTMVEGFGGVRVRRVCAGPDVAFAIGEDGELFSWGHGGGAGDGLLGHGDTQDQLSPKRVEALRGVRMSSFAAGAYHALALAEDGLVYAWGENTRRAVLGNPDVERELLPKPVEALRGVRVGSIATAEARSYAVADTGELWVWGYDNDQKRATPLGRDGPMHHPLPERVELPRGVKVDAVVAGRNHTLALADDRRVYAWGSLEAAEWGVLGLGSSVQALCRPVRKLRRIPSLRAACGRE
jgi:alpha-tubulin suppressor-like RCC1 family protein